MLNILLRPMFAGEPAGKFTDSQVTCRTSEAAPGTYHFRIVELHGWGSEFGIDQVYIYIYLY